jgi:hypothetical protein
MSNNKKETIEDFLDTLDEFTPSVKLFLKC